MSVSTTPIRCPPAASSVATLAVMFDLPVPPRNEWTEMIFATALVLGTCPQLVRSALEVPEIVRVGDLGHLLGGPSRVDLDLELADLLLQGLLAGRYLARHAPEDSGEPAEGVIACCDGVDRLGVEGPVLDCRGRVDDVSDLLDVLTLEVVQTLLRQAAVDSCAQEHGVERLGQVVGRAELDAAHHALDVLERRDHDHRNVAQLLVALDPRQSLVAVQLRHQDVEQDDVEGLGAKRLQRPAAVLDGGDAVALPLEVVRQDHAVDLVVVDDEDRCRALAHEAAACKESATRAYSASIRATCSAAPTRAPVCAVASSSWQSSASLVAPNIRPLDLSVCAARRSSGASAFSSARRSVSSSAGASRRNVSTSSATNPPSPVLARSCSSASWSRTPSSSAERGAQRRNAAASSSRRTGLLT